VTLIKACLVMIKSCQQPRPIKHNIRWQSQSKLTQLPCLYGCGYQVKRIRRHIKKRYLAAASQAVSTCCHILMALIRHALVEVRLIKLNEIKMQL